MEAKQDARNARGVVNQDKRKLQGRSKGLLQGGQSFAGILAAGGGAGGVVVQRAGLVAAEAANAGDGF